MGNFQARNGGFPAFFRILTVRCNRYLLKSSPDCYSPISIVLFIRTHEFPSQELSLFSVNCACMLRNNFKKIVTCTSTLVLFSFHQDKKVTGPANFPLVANVVSRNADYDGTHHRTPIRHTTMHSPADPYLIYLTFDDGPSSGSQLVNELSQRDSLFITVFLIGRNVFLTGKNRALFKDYQVNPLVELGNHSYTHAERHYEKYFENPSEVLADFNRNRDSLRLDNNFARLPGRNFFRIDTLTRNDISSGAEAADTLAIQGYKLFGWDLEWRRRPAKGLGLHTGKEMLEIVEKMLDTKKTFIPGNLIILLHDTELRDEHFMNELEDFIQRAKAEGYRFEHLSAYPG